MKEEDAGVQIIYEWLVTMGDESKAHGNQHNDPQAEQLLHFSETAI